MTRAENFQPEPMASRPHEAFKPAIFEFASDAYINAHKQVQEAVKTPVAHNAAVAHMLNGFSINQDSEAKASLPAPEHPGLTARPYADAMVKPSTDGKLLPAAKPVPENSSKSHDGMECKVAYATLYHPTGNRTADGSTYTDNNDPVAAAVDNKHPIGGVRLGTVLTITNLDPNSSHRTANVVVRDTGGFGRLSTPEKGIARGVDLTNKASELLQTGDMTKVEVCWPAAAGHPDLPRAGHHAAHPGHHQKLQHHKNK